MRYVASGVYVMNSTKNLKTIILFKLNDGNLFPGQIPRRVFNSGRWEMLQTSSIISIRKTIHNMQAEHGTEATVSSIGYCLYRKPKDRL